MTTGEDMAAPAPGKSPPGADRPGASALIAEAEETFAAVGWLTFRATTLHQALAYLEDLARGRRLVVVHRDALTDLAEVSQALAATADRVEEFGDGDRLARDDARALLSRADLGVTGATALVAETGSVILAEQAGYGRLVSNLPPVHAVLAYTGLLVPSLSDGLRLVRERWSRLPRYVSGISGPSKTGDIDMEIVRGMHGPGEVHLVLLDSTMEGGLVPPRARGVDSVGQQR